MEVMGILRASVLLCFLVTTCLAIDEHRPQRKDKRQLGYQISHHYASLPSSYRLDRRISTGPQYHPHHPPPHYPRPYHKDYPHSNDLLTDGNNHLEQHHSGYGPPKPHIIERPVYIKEPEPIIEIIIKESNVSLPAPPPPPPPPKKKKEQVQVFYVKYQKNPNGKGKDAIIYDKPVPAISPKLPEDEEEEVEEAPYNYHTDLATAPPPPSTTLRTIIKPDSEVYHSPSGVKVTFGKEGFDYDKRSSKPEDYVPTYQKQQQQQQPQGRQLTSFSNAYFKRPASIQGFQSPSFSSSLRQPQPYRPITFPSSTFKTFGRQQYQQQPQFQQPPQFSRPSQPFNSFGSQGLTSPHFSHSISHPPPPRFQNSRPPPPAIPPRQPVPYTPFDKIRPQQPFPQPLSSHQSPPHQQQQIQFRPESHFPIYQQLPLAQQNYAFKPPRFSQVLQTVKEERIPPQPIVQQQLPLEHEHHEQFQQVPQYQQQSQVQHEQPSQQHDPQPTQPQSFSHQQSFQQHQQSQQDFQQHQQSQQDFQQHQPSQQDLQQHQQSQQPPQQNQQKLQQNFNHQHSQSQQSHPQNFLQHNFNTERPQIQQQPVNNQLSQNDHLNILPPGGQLIQSVSKYEQHFSTVEPSTAQNSKFQQKAIQDFNSQENLQSFSSNEHVSSHELLEHQKAFERQKELLEQRKQQQHKLLEEQRKRLQEEQLKQYFEQQQQQESRNPGPSANSYYQSTRKEFVSSTPGIRYQSTTSSPSTTTTTEAVTPSTTTKDPKILEAQLPDEVPEELREQLLSSGILNNADISVLDYDKVGDIPLSALPPDQLANFYNAGGAAQIGAGSEPVAARLQTDGSEVRNSDTQEAEEEESAASELDEVKVDAPTKKETVDLKVVRYDPESNGGKQVQESYVADTAETVNPVVLNDNSYSRYLPLKVNGTQFPIPDVPELKGKKISSVVVLAPVSYDFSASREARNTREERQIKKDTPNAPGDIGLIQDATLKKLIMEPTLENYRKFLDIQNKTKNDQQSVILLVADPSDPESTEKEIFMYDVATQTVSKLSGELSSAFVEAAEANSAPPKDGQMAASSMIETKVPFPQQDWSETGSNILERRMSVQDDMEAEVTDQVEKTVDVLDSDKTGQ